MKHHVRYATKSGDRPSVIECCDRIVNSGNPSRSSEWGGTCSTPSPLLFAPCRVPDPALPWYILQVERILEYTKEVPQEAAHIVQGRRPAQSWPDQGALSVENLTVQYPNTDEPVIRGMTFEVAPQTRVGIVGRTGAGKSSLTAALFRLVEPSAGSRMIIDGVDALSLGLADLRSRLAIVPQVRDTKGDRKNKHTESEGTKEEQAEEGTLGRYRDRHARED